MRKFNKTTSLLICGTIIGSVVPLTAANASVVELENKDGLIYDAKAFANGLYIYDGYKTEDAEIGTYFSTPKGDLLIENVTGLGERYGMNYINFRDNDILFNLATGQVENESEEDKLADLENKFRRNVLKKVKRYKDIDKEDFEIKEKLAVDCFSDVWYEAEIKDDDNDRNYTVYINEKGEYIDVSETLNIDYYDVDGNKVKLNTYKDLMDYNGEKGYNVLNIPMIKSLMVDSSNIYRAFVLVDNDKVQNNSELLEKLSKLDINDKNYEKNKLGLLIGYDAATVYTQKISMEQGEKKDGAYLPKKVETYEAYDLIDVLIEFIAGNEVHARVRGKDIYILQSNSDKNRISMEKYKMKTVRDKIGEETISKKAIEKDKSFNGIKDEPIKDFSIDAYGDLWVLSKGKIKKSVNGELETLYKVDGSMNRLSVFNDNSMIVWNTDSEIYAELNKTNNTTENSSVENIEEEISSENVNEPVQGKIEIQIGWVKNQDGSWSYKTQDGNVASGWIRDNEKWYYLNNNGVMITGWVKDGADWYYLNESGEMKTGWHKDNNGKWYYLYESGKMAYDTVVNGYTIDSNGVWI